jgi:hypothetical protein
VNGSFPSSTPVAPLYQYPPTIPGVPAPASTQDEPVEVPQYAGLYLADGTSSNLVPCPTRPG